MERPVLDRLGTGWSAELSRQIDERTPGEHGRDSPVDRLP